MPLDLYMTAATVSCVAAACAVLSVLVVARRWAFIGEGISHSGFGGAGTAWLAALALPALDHPWVTYLAVVLFCLATALAIGYVSRQQGLNSDAAIGIFLVASLAWGFVGQRAYLHARHMEPYGFDTLLFGHMRDLSPQFAMLAVAISASVLLTLAALRKEILYYCLDPLMAEASGVRAGFIHYLLLLLIAGMIVIGVRVAGSVLVTALLVLPGAAATLLSRKFGHVTCIAVLAGVLAAIAGLLINNTWRYVDAGPAIVLALFVSFLAALVASKLRSPS